MVKLIDSENLTEIMNLRDDSPNIDITSVHFLGKSVELAVDKIVSAPPQDRIDIARARFLEGKN